MIIRVVISSDRCLEARKSNDFERLVAAEHSRAMISRKRHALCGVFPHRAYALIGATGLLLSLVYSHFSKLLSSFNTIQMKGKLLEQALDESAAELLCPITQALPIDPVIAEDGRVYEREAIEEWLVRRNVSPQTNEAMGSKVISAVQARNMIERMVRSGAVVGSKARPTPSPAAAQYREPLVPGQQQK